MARSWPIFSNRLLTLGLNVLHEPAPPDLPAITRALMRYADTGQDQRRAVAIGIRDLLSGSAITRATVKYMQEHEIPTAEIQVDMKLGARGLHAVRKDPAVRLAADPVADWDEFIDEINTAPVTGSALKDLQRAATAAAGARDGTAWPDGVSAIQAALRTPHAAQALEAALSRVLPAKPVLYRILRDRVLPDVYRTAPPFDSEPSQTL
jgi:hypothetical protein